MTPIVLLLGIIWVISFACSVAAILLLVLSPGRSRWALVMALAAVVVSGMAFIGRTPFGRLPEVGYSWSNGSFEISLRLGSLYLAPLVVGAVALLMGLWKRRKSRGAYVQATSRSGS